MILIVDDDKSITMYLKSILENSGYDTHIIMDGHLVLDYLKENKPELILLDNILGKDITGDKILYQIRKNHNYDNIPVVMFTSCFTNEFLGKTLMLGADYFISKEHSNPQHLIMTITAILQRYRRIERYFKREK